MFLFKKTLLVILISILHFTSFTQTPEKIKWLNFEEGVKMSAQSDKKMFIDIYTDWCGWCKKMDAIAFQDKDVIRLMNQYFIPVKLNGEHKGDIQFKGKTFKFIDNGRRGYHELPAGLMNGQASYPTLVLLDKDIRIIQTIPSYLTAKQMKMVLEYIGADIYKSKNWQEFEKSYE